jgi:hypothetical protein
MNASRPPSNLPRLLASALIALAPLTLAGCSRNPAAPKPVAVVPAPPAPSSTTAAVQAFQWDMTHRDWQHYGQLLADNFTFAFSATDPKGALFTNRAMNRGDEVISAQRILSNGFGSLPAAKTVTLDLGPIQPTPDSRTGKTFPWHQQIRVGVTLSVDNGPDQYNVTGVATFYLVRGDSAQIPADLAAQGFHPDPNRWWIERWEDGTGVTPAPGSRAQATLKSTWGALKVLYLTGTPRPAP